MPIYKSPSHMKLDCMIKKNLAEKSLSEQFGKKFGKIQDNSSDRHKFYVSRVHSIECSRLIIV